MVFEIRNKVVVITGGASGIGFAFCRLFLTKGVKGITIADIDLNEGERVADNLQFEFGEERVIFVHTDVAETGSFENVFKYTIEKFKNVDILINNAGIFNDNLWSREVDINLKGTINGMVLGLENYLRNHKQGEEAVILNISSIHGVSSVPMAPVFTAVNHGIVGLTQSWGDPVHFDRTKVRVFAVCPGLTNTEIFKQNEQNVIDMSNTINKEYDAKLIFDESEVQSPEFVANESFKLIESAPNGTVWIIEDKQPSYEYIAPERTSFQEIEQPKSSCSVM